MSGDLDRETLYDWARRQAQALLEEFRSRGIGVGVDWAPGTSAIDRTPGAFLHLARFDGGEAKLSGFDVQRLSGLEAMLIDLVVERAILEGTPDCPHRVPHGARAS